jgi:hypothetical protein
MSRNGVTLIEAVFFDGMPRTRVGVSYIVKSPRKPDGREFETIEAARKYFNVQASLRPRGRVASE